MDNIGNTLYFIERIESNPNKADYIYDMNYFKIVSIINNPELQGIFYKDKDSCNVIVGDNNIEIKAGGCFKFNTKESFVLKNDDVINFLETFHFRSDYTYVKNQTLLPLNIFNYYLINYYNKSIQTNFFIIVISIDIKNISSDFYKSFMNIFRESKDIHNKFFINYILTLLKYHFYEVNNIQNLSCENKEILSRINNITSDYLLQKMIDNPTFLNTKLFLYQRANLFWMISRENNKERFILDENAIVNWGPELEFNFNSHDCRPSFSERFQPKINISTLSPDELSIRKKESIFNKFTGGCLCDDVGLGKTIQILTLCFLKPSKNLIIVPNHLYEHWQIEYIKHIKDEQNFINFNSSGSSLVPDSSNYTILISFSDYNEHFEFLNNIKWDRVIIDEFHETIIKKFYNKVINIKAKYKWAVSATPFINSDMIFNILNFIASKKITNTKISKHKKYLDIFTNMFRRNTKDSITAEVKLPRIKEIAYYLDFSEKERLYYKTVEYKDTIDRLKFCINPNIYLLDKEKKFDENFISIDKLDDNVMNIHKESYEKKYIEIIEAKRGILLEYNIILKNIFYSQEDIESKWDTFKDNTKVMSKKHIIDKLEKELNNIKSTMTYFESQLKVINDKIKPVDDKLEYKEMQDNDCSICMDKITTDCAILQCGHFFHSDCIDYLIKEGHNKCPMCKMSLKNTTIFSSKIKNTETNNNLIEMYGTKIAHLINIIKNNITDDKIILYCHSPSLLANISKILTDNSIGNNDFKNIKDFKTNSNKVLILSSDDNASGLHLTYISTIILLQPIEGDYMYRKQIENQIIGRSHRIGQDKEISFIRLIINDTIEHQMEIENIMAEDKCSLRIKTDLTEIKV